jgi:CRISPR system Cascade subunit CasE
VYLSRVILNQRSRGVQRLLADCHLMHRTIMQAFPAVPTGGDDPRRILGVLYRVETDRRSLVKIIVQSGYRPDWSVIDPGWLAVSMDFANPACKEIDRQYSQISTGMVLSFVLRANPTRKIGSTSKKERLAGAKKNNGRRIFITSEFEQHDWLNRKAAAGGFELVRRTEKEQPALIVRAPERAYGRHEEASDAPEKMPLVFSMVDYQGRLVVKDVDLFRSSLSSGFGSGKAYGCGLMLVAPAR